MSDRKALKAWSMSDLVSGGSAFMGSLGKLAGGSVWRNFCCWRVQGLDLHLVEDVPCARTVRSYLRWRFLGP